MSLYGIRNRIKKQTCYLRSRLDIIEAACADFDMDNVIRGIINELVEQPLPENIREALFDISEHVLVGDFDEAAALARSIK